MPRYVVQHHVLGPDDDHWDLMLEVGDVLWTWSLPAAPDAPEALPLCAQRLPDHRPAYLEYEGPVSGARGEVTVHDRGSYRWLGDAPARAVDLVNVLRFEICEGRLSGTFELKLVPQDGKDLWRLRHLPEGAGLAAPDMARPRTDASEGSPAEPLS